MSDIVLLSTGLHNLEACIQVASVHHLGIELMPFALPNVLNGDYEGTVRHVKTLLSNHRGPLTMHGPFIDMAPGSPDEAFKRITLERSLRAIDTAQELGVGMVVFHANFIAMMRNPEYRRSWHQHSLKFWEPVAQYAADHQVRLVIENMWEFDPSIIGDLLRDLEHPSLRACLDVGHSQLFSDYSLEEWLEVLSPYLIHSHMNNNGGEMDYHRSLSDGVLDYHAILARFRQLPSPPSMTLEMDTLDDMLASLPYFQIAKQDAVL